MFNRVYTYLKRISDSFSDHQCSIMASACAYCALLSLVPLLVVGISVLGYLMGGSKETLGQVMKSISGYVPISPLFLQSTLQRVLADRGMIGFFGLIGLLISAHQIFLSLMPAMNQIWNVKERRNWARQRVIAVGLTLITLMLLGADLVISGLIAYLQNIELPLLNQKIGSPVLTRIGIGLLPPIITTFLCAYLYRTLPDTRVPWKSAIIGAGIAACLWEVIKVGFGIFLQHAHSYDRLYGSLSSLVILVVWMYYSMAILLLGAEIAADYATHRSDEKSQLEGANSVPKDLA